MFISTPVLLYLDVRSGRVDQPAEEKLPAGAKPKAG
jgi:preprotein translocase subunit SecF